MHVHSLVYVLAEVSSEAGWMHVYVCVLVGGVGLKTRGPDSAAAGQIAPQKVGHCTVHAHLCFVMEKQGVEGWEGNVCVTGSS